MVPASRFLIRRCCLLLLSSSPLFVLVRPCIVVMVVVDYGDAAALVLVLALVCAVCFCRCAIAVVKGSHVLYSCLFLSLCYRCR